MTDPSIEKTSAKSDPWLIAIGLALVMLYLLLIWQIIGQTDQLVLNAAYCLAIITLLHQRFKRLDLTTDCLSTSIGIFLLALLIIKSCSLVASDSVFIHVFPGIAAIGLGLIASGFKLHHYWQEGILIAVLMLPSALVNHFIEELAGSRLQLIIAQLSTFIMHYIGFTVSRQGINVIMPNGTVAVAYGCTGNNMLILLWQMCIPAVLLLPLSRFLKLCMPVLAIFLVLILASIRVAIMASVVDEPISFNYWHGSAGNQIFSNIGILAFGCLCWWLVEHHLATNIKPLVQSQNKRSL